MRRADSYTVGVLVQTNYGGKLTIAGVPVWKELVAPHRDPRRPHPRRQLRTLGVSSAHPRRQVPHPRVDVDGSCMIVVATDAPLDARDLERLAARAIFAHGPHRLHLLERQRRFRDRVLDDASLRVGDRQHGPQQKTILPTDAVSGLFEATLDATEEAIYNSLLKATDTTGSGRTIRALPIEELKALLKKYGR